jgi:hypothetical protein
MGDPGRKGSRPSRRHMKTPQAHEFLRAWRDVAALRENELLANWYNRTPFTAIVKDERGCMVEKVSETIRLSCYSEYYHTDTIFYDKETDLVPEIPANQTWVRAIKVAFEHEHSYNNKLYEEISHLLILDSLLSVCVTYPPEGDFRDLPHLQYFHSIIRGSPRANELDGHENFLLIFGYRDPLKWRGLVYKNDWWKEIAAP